LEPLPAFGVKPKKGEEADEFVEEGQRKCATAAPPKAAITTTSSAPTNGWRTASIVRRRDGGGGSAIGAEAEADAPVAADAYP
jgi:hypothetical protein